MLEAWARGSKFGLITSVGLEEKKKRYGFPNAFFPPKRKPSQLLPLKSVGFEMKGVGNAADALWSGESPWLRRELEGQLPPAAPWKGWGPLGGIKWGGGLHHGLVRA